MPSSADNQDTGFWQAYCTGVDEPRWMRMFSTGRRRTKAGADLTPFVSAGRLAAPVTVDRNPQAAARDSNSGTQCRRPRRANAGHRSRGMPAPTRRLWAWT